MKLSGVEPLFTLLALPGAACQALAATAIANACISSSKAMRQVGELSGV